MSTRLVLGLTLGVLCVDMVTWPFLLARVLLLYYLS